MIAPPQTDEDEIARIRASVRPLLIDSGIQETPIGIWGTCFLATYQAQLFAVTAAHLVKGNHSGEIRLLASDRSMKRLPLSQGIGVLADAADDEVDLIVYPASLIGLHIREAQLAQIINLDLPGLMSWNPFAHAAQFLVIGYPRDYSNIDYESEKVSAGQVLLTGSYTGPSVGRGAMHRLEIENRVELTEFAGFSGSPVFSVTHQVAAKPIYRFCGVAVTGTATSGAMHFVDAATLARLMTVATGHVGKFGLQLATSIGRKK